MTLKQNLMAKCTLPILLAASFTMLVGCGGSTSTGSSSNQTQSNSSSSTPTNSAWNSNNTSDAGKSNASGSGADKNGNTTDSGTNSSTNSSSNNNSSTSSSTSSSDSSSSSSTTVSGSNGITTQPPQGKMVAFDAVTDLNSLPPQTKGMVDVHKAENGVFRDDENGSTYILIGSGKSPSEGLTLRAEKVTEDNDKITVTTSEFKPGSAGPAVPYFVIKIKQTSKPVQAYNLGYTK